MVSIDFLRIPSRIYVLDKHKAFTNHKNKIEFIKHFGNQLTVDDFLEYLKKHAVYDESVIRYIADKRWTEGFRKNTNSIHEIILDDDSYKDAALIAQKSGTSTAALLGGIVQSALRQLKVTQS